LLLDSVTLDSKGANATDTTRHLQLFFWAKVDLKVLNQMALLSVDKLPRYRFRVLLLSLGVLLCFQRLLLALTDRNLLLGSDLFRLLPCCITANKQLGLVSLHEILAPRLGIKYLAIGGGWAFRLLRVSFIFVGARLALRAVATCAIVPIAAMVGTTRQFKTELAIHLNLILISLSMVRNRLIEQIHVFVVDCFEFEHSGDGWFGGGVIDNGRVALHLHSRLHFF